MAANPFLFSEEAYTSPSSAGSNPFLMGDDDDGDVTPQNENPFLSQTATAAISTNPFSFDPTELEPAEAEMPQESTSMDAFGDFSNENLATTTHDSPFDQPAEPILPKIEASSISPQKPSDLNLKYTNAGFNNLPPRPPPPRPPPSKETQDLLMSVMGAMDATSSTFLDKIPPTRTPSPVSMRDLHSPCPTPEPPFGDLLDVGDKPEVTNNINFNDQDLVTLEQDNVCDINQNPAVNLVENNGKPPRPTPPARPPKPPLPPALLNNVPKEPTMNDITSAQPPPPPAQPNTNNVNIVDEMDMFGMEDRPQKPVTKADILNLYNTPKQETIKDLLCDNDETDMILQNTETVTTTVEESDKTQSPPPLPKENISPQSHQDDPKTDLSESHSKESVSTTVNPFATSGDVTPQQPVVSQELFESEAETINQDKAMDIFNTTVDDTKSNVFAQESFGMEKPAESVNPDSFGVPAPSAIPARGAFEVPAVAPAVFAEDAFGVPAAAPAVFDGDAFGAPAAASTVFAEDAFGAPAAAPTVFAEDAFGAPAAAPAVFAEDAFGAPAAPVADVFGVNTAPMVPDAFAATNSVPVIEDPFGFSGGASTRADDFDEFSKKFDSVMTDASKFGGAWGNEGSSGTTGDVSSGFGQEGFDAFLALQEPPCVPQSTPNRVSKAASQESDEDKDFSVFIRPKGTDELDSGILPTIAPPPVPQQLAFVDTSPRFNPFDNQTDVSNAFVENDVPFVGEMTRTDSQETPPTPLFDDDVSQPLEPFPRTIYTEEGWEMHLRQPNKKKITGQRFWKKIFVRLLYQTDCVLLQLFNQKDDKDPFQELPLQPCYSVSDIGAQQYDQFGKIFTVKLQYIFYKERPGVRPGQVKKAERITNKLSQFAAYAIQGDYQGVKEFGSDLKKLGLPVEHAPQVSQLMKLGSLNFEDLKQFSMCIEESLFRLQAHRDRALHYKMEEVQITAVDELYVEQDAEGHVEKQIARVRLFFLGFLTGMPDVELGVNDMRRQGKEVVGRHDIIPVVTEEWIRLENVEFHSCIQQEDYNNTHIIKFKPPDACYIELMRFRVRPPKNRELPLQLKAQICITGYKVELRADVLVPGFTSRKLGQVPCEDVMIRFPIPECWIYLFRVEKHFRYGSVKSAHRRTGKVKGIERILGAMETLQENLIEVTSGHAKYEHQHRAIVWRCPRLPKEGQGAYTTHNMVCRVALTNFDQMPDKLAEYCYVEFTMPATQVSHTTCRSVSMQNSDSDEPPEKYVRYLARHEYRVGIERTQGESPNAYSAATFVTKSAPPPPAPVESTPKVVEESSSDSDD